MGHACLLWRSLRACALSPIMRIAPGSADEDDAGVDAGLGEVLVLGQEAVAGMDGVAAIKFARGGDQRRDVQVACRRLGAADGDRFIGQPDRQRILVRAGVDLTVRMSISRHARMIRRAISPCSQSIPFQFHVGLFE